MTSDKSVTHWIRQAKAGDPFAAQQLWERYFQRLVGLARKKLQHSPRRAADEEDVALSAFDSFWHGAQQGRFPQLSDRDNLWRLLLVITARKSIDLAQRERRKKRGGGAVQGESAFLEHPNSAKPAAGIEQVLSQTPTPDFAAQMTEECQRLLGRLGDVQLQQVALWKMEGYTVEEIAQKLDCVPRTVDRKLKAIRAIWQQQQDREI